MNNSGGLHTIHLLHRKYFLGTIYISNSNTYQLQLDAGAVFTQLPFTLDTANFKQKSKSGSEGKYYQVEVSCLVPKISPELDKIYQEYDDEEIVLIIQDTNNNYILIGNSEETFLLNEDADSGTDFIDRNRNELSFSRDFRQRAKFIQAPF